MSQNIDHIFYINLEKRQDRKEEIENELNTHGLVGERFDAIPHNPGCVGCAKSHLSVLHHFAFPMRNQHHLPHSNPPTKWAF